MTRKIVVLRSTEDDHDMRHLQATLTSGGDVVIEGQDIGDSVEQIFGCWEYEWTWTIRAAELKSFLESHNIPHDTSSRIGD